MKYTRVSSSPVLITLISVASLIYSGCANYVLKDFPSKQNFYNSFNNFAKGKTLNIKLTNGSTFIYSKGVFIRGDSLVLKGCDTYREAKALSVKDIKDINYYSVDFRKPSAYLELKDGEKLNAESISFRKDSIGFINVESKDKYIPLNEVNKIYYTNRWLGAGIGFPAGTLIGYVLLDYGILPPFKSAGWDQYFSQHVTSRIEELLWVPVAAAVIGAIIGYTYNYQFNN